MDRIKVLILGREPIFTEGLCHLLQGQDDVEVVASMEYGQENLENTLNYNSDVVIIETELMESKILDIIRYLNRNRKKILVLDSGKIESEMSDTIKAGARGFLPRSVSFSTLANSIRLIYEGQYVFSPVNLNSLAEVLSFEEKGRNGNGKPSKREIQLLKLAAEGKNNSKIAQELNISERTVHTHLKNIFAKLGVHSRIKAITYALKNGWFDVNNLDVAVAFFSLFCFYVWAYIEHNITHVVLNQIL